MVKRVLISCALAVLVVTMTGPAAQAVPGDEATSEFAFAVRLEVGPPGRTGSHACTGALVTPRAVLTASECLPATQPVPAVLARLDATTTMRVVAILPDRRPGLSLAVLARPVRTLTVPLTQAAATAGEQLAATGFGRTADTWVPDRAHLSSFSVGSATSDLVNLGPAAAEGVGLCQGDAGAPLTRTAAGRRELVAIALNGRQRGCLGSSDTSADISARPITGLALASATSDPFDQLTLSPTDSASAPLEDTGFGSAVAMADFNKDGRVDIAVGAPRDATGANAERSGTVHVFNSGLNGPSAGTRLLQSRFNAGDEAGDLFGSALTTGDFNGDGWADLAIGTPGEVVEGVKAGAVAVFNGSSSGLNQARGIDQNDLNQNEFAGDQFGKALAAGDFNGDGFTDLAVGVPGKVINNARSGQVTVLKGSSTGLRFGWVVTQSGGGGGNEAGDLFGDALAVGNVLGNKTGTVFADLVVGVPGEAPNADPQSGLVYVYPGSASGVGTGGVGITQIGNGGANELGDRFGAALGTGDFNKDGWADIAVGIPGEAPRTDPQSGTATIIPGGNSAVGAGYPIEARDVPGGQNLAGDLFGSAFATGDANADGYADLLVGSSGRASGSGLLYVFSGGPVSSAQPRSLTPRTVIRHEDIYGTPEPADRLGAALAFGDLNQDGRADALVGSPGEGAPGEPPAGMAITLSRVLPS